MAIAKKAILSLTALVVKLTEKRLKAGKYAGDEQDVEVILAKAKDILAKED